MRVAAVWANSHCCTQHSMPRSAHLGFLPECKGHKVRLRALHAMQKATRDRLLQFQQSGITISWFGEVVRVFFRIFGFQLDTPETYDYALTTKKCALCARRPGDDPFGVYVADSVCFVAVLAEREVGGRGVFTISAVCQRGRALPRIVGTETSPWVVCVCVCVWWRCIPTLPIRYEARSEQNTKEVLAAAAAVTAKRSAMVRTLWARHEPPRCALGCKLV